MLFILGFRRMSGKLRSRYLGQLSQTTSALSTASGLPWGPSCNRASTSRRDPFLEESLVGTTCQQSKQIELIDCKKRKGHQLY